MFSCTEGGYVFSHIEGGCSAVKAAAIVSRGVSLDEEDLCVWLLDKSPELIFPLSRGVL